MDAQNDLDVGFNAETFYGKSRERGEFKMPEYPFRKVVRILVLHPFAGESDIYRAALKGTGHGGWAGVFLRALSVSPWANGTS